MNKRWFVLLPLLAFFGNCGTEPDEELDRPKAQILIPADSAHFTYGAAVSFRGMGIGKDGDSLTGPALVWSSDKDGDLGTGASVSSESLSVNRHTISLYATDKDTTIAVDHITIFIDSAGSDSTGGRTIARISAPANNSIFDQGDTIHFAGYGLGKAGDTLAATTMVWNSDKDGQIGTGRNPSVTTLSVATHKITLIATKSDSEVAVASINVVVMDSTSQITQPTATIRLPLNNSNFIQNDTITFSGTGLGKDRDTLTGTSLVWLSDKDGEIGTGNILKTNQLSVNSHKITLMVTDKYNLIAVQKITVTIISLANAAPTAIFTVTPDTGTINTNFSFNASGCSDAKDNAADLQVRWDWNNSGTFTAWSKTKTATNKYTSIGLKQVVMEVKDTDGLTDTYTKQILVKNTPPIAGLLVIPGMGDTSTTFNLNATDCTDLEDAATSLEVRWDWEGDGIWDMFWSTTKTTTHKYDTTGTMDLTMEVRDTQRMSDTMVVNIIVGP